MSTPVSGSQSSCHPEPDREKHKCSYMYIEFHLLYNDPALWFIKFCFLRWKSWWGRQAMFKIPGWRSLERVLCSLPCVVCSPGNVFMTDSREFRWRAARETCQGTPQFSCIHYLFLCSVMFSTGNLLKIYIFASNAVILYKCLKMSRSDGKWRWVKKEKLFCGCLLIAHL